jgi:hypothetical protein
MFSFFKKNSRDDAQPRKEWPWTLTLGAYPGQKSRPTWEDVRCGLESLAQDSDSYLILEQRDPANPKRHYWYIQCAVALQGPNAGKYSLEVGCWKDGKGHLLDRTLPMLEQVISYFDWAYRWKPLDLSVFEDMSDMVQ